MCRRSHQHCVADPPLPVIVMCAAAEVALHEEEVGSHSPSLAGPVPWLTCSRVGCQALHPHLEHTDTNMLAEFYLLPRLQPGIFPVNQPGMETTVLLPAPHGALCRHAVACWARVIDGFAAVCSDRAVALWSQHRSLGASTLSPMRCNLAVWGQA